MQNTNNAAMNRHLADFKNYLKIASNYSLAGNMERTEYYLVEADRARDDAYRAANGQFPELFAEMAKQVSAARRELLT